VSPLTQGLRYRAACDTDQSQYDTIEQFNVNSKAECDQLNLAHVARKKIRKKRN